MTHHIVFRGTIAYVDARAGLGVRSDRMENRSRAAEGGTCVTSTRSLSGPRTERGFSPAQLLSVVSVVMAGNGEGRLSRSRQYRFGIRPRGPRSQIRNSFAERNFIEGVYSRYAPAGVYAVQRIPARPFFVPVLRGCLPNPRTDVRSCRTPFTRRPDDMG